MLIIVKILKEHIARKRRVEVVVPVDRHLHVNIAYYHAKRLV